MMTEEQMIAIVKSMSGESDEIIVSAYLAMAGQQIINRAFPFATEKDLSKMTVPARYQQKQVEFAAYMLNKRGAEGEISHNENGINRSYENGGLPDSMLKEIIPFCSVPGGGSYAGTSAK
jgi:hypothetical protein